jgi:hypothetical protein
MQFGVKTKHQKMVLAVTLAAIFFVAFTSMAVALMMREQNEQLSTNIVNAFFKNQNAQGLGNIKSQGRGVGLQKNFSVVPVSDCSLCDVNADSVVDVKDIRSLSYCVATAMCASLDANADGTISLSEASIEAKPDRGNIQQNYNRYEKACSGLKIAGLKDEEGKPLSCNFDTTGDGQLTREDVAACALTCFYPQENVTPQPTTEPSPLTPTVNPTTAQTTPEPTEIVEPTEINPLN